MRQYLIDEIPKKEMERVRDYLEERTLPTGLQEIFWIELPPDLLSPLQWEHRDCGPHYLAIETGKDFVKFEFLVRGQNKFRCECVQYTTPAQEAYLLRFAHTLIETLELKT
ncbi:MAG: hypothetical protein HY892_19170 [Deltaproteobacteria bacterium]|nr:hypothetical protein [Deltaproteobacteria bacterium]